eukprot:TRINITY_DN4193_c0_g1_i1.p1 TRINITY_DN4193_c0_g1~~TRINITY_DN4193_c0_g1_i1.p1  ORF type:complete len:110 (+),score=26.86 TRINITY_DN4193_c0_g1_i1:783-1112(+)
MVYVWLCVSLALYFLPQQDKYVLSLGQLSSSPSAVVLTIQPTQFLIGLAIVVFNSWSVWAVFFHQIYQQTLRPQPPKVSSPKKGKASPRNSNSNDKTNNTKTQRKPKST